MQKQEKSKRKTVLLFPQIGGFAWCRDMQRDGGPRTESLPQLYPLEPTFPRWPQPFLCHPIPSLFCHGWWESCFLSSAWMVYGVENSIVLADAVARAGNCQVVCGAALSPSGCAADRPFFSAPPPPSHPRGLQLGTKPAAIIQAKHVNLADPAAPVWRSYAVVSGRAVRSPLLPLFIRSAESSQVNNFTSNKPHRGGCRDWGVKGHRRQDDQNRERRDLLSRDGAAQAARYVRHRASHRSAARPRSDRIELNPHDGSGSTWGWSPRHAVPAILHGMGVRGLERLEVPRGCRSFPRAKPGLGGTPRAGHYVNSPPPFPLHKYLCTRERSGRETKVLNAD